MRNEEINPLTELFPNRPCLGFQGGPRSIRIQCSAPGTGSEQAELRVKGNPEVLVVVNYRGGPFEDDHRAPLSTNLRLCGPQNSRQGLDCSRVLANLSTFQIGLIVSQISLPKR